jgi:hypothetical protein
MCKEREGVKKTPGIEKNYISQLSAEGAGSWDLANNETGRGKLTQIP